MLVPRNIAPPPSFGDIDMVLYTTCRMDMGRWRRGMLVYHVGDRRAAELRHVAAAGRVAAREARRARAFEDDTSTEGSAEVEDDEDLAL